MTNMIEAGEPVILKADKLGRVKTPAARRERLLDEFERSGLGGQEFASLSGIKYQTFATWVQQRRRQARGNTRSGEVCGDSSVAGGGGGTGKTSRPAKLGGHGVASAGRGAGGSGG